MPLTQPISSIQTAVAIARPSFVQPTLLIEIGHQGTAGQGRVGQSRAGPNNVAPESGLILYLSAAPPANAGESAITIARPQQAQTK